MKSDEYMLYQTGPYLQLTMENFIFDRISVDIICIIQGGTQPSPHLPETYNKILPCYAIIHGAKSKSQEHLVYLFRQEVTSYL